MPKLIFAMDPGTGASVVHLDGRPVQSYELLSLASIPREEALKIASRSAAQFVIDNPPPRAIWNFRCDQCFCNAPVYVANNLCFACDGGNETSPAKPKRELWNARCNLCRAEAPVFLDNNLCEECDFGVVD